MSRNAKTKVQSSQRDPIITSDNKWNYLSRNKGLPTGKYKVPGSKTDAIYFFNKYGENYVFFNEEDNECIVNFTGKYQVPAPNTVYMNNELLRNYHISTQEFYDYLEKYDVLFSEACHWKSDKNIVITKSNGALSTNSITGDLPIALEREAFDRCIKNLQSRRVNFKITKDKYGNLLSFLSVYATHNRIHIIESTEIKVVNNAEYTHVKILFDKPSDILELSRVLLGDFELEIIV